MFLDRKLSFQSPKPKFQLSLLLLMASVITAVVGITVISYLPSVTAYEDSCHFSCPFLTHVAVYKKYSPAAFIYQYYPSTGLNLSIPTDWSLGQSAQAINEISTFLSPLQDQSDKFRENILIKHGWYLSNLTIPEFSEATINGLKKLHGFQLLERDDNFTLGGKPANKIVYSYSENRIPYTSMQVGTMMGRGFLTITYNAELGKYGEYLPAVEKILKSVKMDWRRFNIPLHNASSASLENWSRGNDKYLSSIFTIFSPLDNASDLYFDNLRISMMPVGNTNTSARAMTLEVEKSFQKNLPNFKVIDRKNITVSENPAYSITYTFAGQDGQDHKIQRIATIHENKEFIIYYDSTNGTYEKYLPVLHQILSAIRF